MKVVRWMSVMILAAAGTCFGDDINCSSNPLRPSIVPPCTSILGQVSKAMDAMRDFQRVSAEATAAIRAARRAYWNVFPDGPGVKEAELKFLDLLLQKDFTYVNYALPLGMNDPVVQMVNLGMMDVDNMGKFPRNVDDGIRPYAFPLFANWVNALRRSQGREHDGAFATLDIMKTAIEDRSNYRRAYEDGRNWAEFMASGLDIRKYLTPQVYMVNEMEADIALAAAKAKPKDLPEPKRASVDLYNFFVKNFGEKETPAAAAKTLAAPKNSIGGLAQRAEVLIGTYQQQPSPNPYLMFLTQLTNATPHNYALALCLDPYGLMGKEAIFTVNSREQWEKAAGTYRQLAAKFGEPAVVAAAARIKDLPKDGTGGIRGDTQSKGAIYWFTTLLKDPKTPLPESGQFLASSYDPRWVGKMVNVRGTVSRVDVDKGKFPPYATIHFKESKNDKFTAYTPNPEIIDEILPRGVTSLVGGVIEVYGDVSDWKDGGGVRFLMRNNLKLLDNNALANFKESSPEWMKLPPAPPPSNLVDSPKYLAWKKFPVGSKATYYVSMLNEVKPGSNQYTKTKIATNTFTLASIDESRGVIKEDAITYRMSGPPINSTNELTYKAKETKAADDPSTTTTQGDETLSINGKKIASHWVSVAKTDDPQTFTKTWTSDEVPGGLVWLQSQSHSRGPARTISNNLYAPVPGVEPVVDNPSMPAAAPVTGASPAPVERQMNAPASRGGMVNNSLPATSPPSVPAPTAPAATPSAAASPAVAPEPTPRATRRAVAPPAIREPPARTPTATGDQADFMAHYRIAMQRYARDGMQIRQAQRNVAMKGPGAAEMQGTLENLRKQQQAASMAMAKQDYVAADAALHAMEDALTVIENLTAK